MLGLILPHRHKVGVVDEDIRRHQHRVGEQTAVHIVGMLGGLVLELGHAGQLAKLGVAAQHPGKLGVGGHMALHKQHMLFGVDAHRQQQRGHLPRLAAQVGRDLPHRQRVKVRHHIQAVIILLQQRPVAHRADVVAQRGRAGGLDARQNALARHRLIFCHKWSTPYLYNIQQYCTTFAGRVQHFL